MRAALKASSVRSPLEAKEIGMLGKVSGKDGGTEQKGERKIYN